jgi:hypothetical protein
MKFILLNVAIYRGADISVNEVSFKWGIIPVSGILPDAKIKENTLNVGILVKDKKVKLPASLLSDKN